MDLENQEEELTLKSKINRFAVGLLMTILMGMLVITLIPNDAEQNFYRMITGQDTYTAGKIGDSNIPMDYFQAARRDCYQRYKDSQPNAANDESAINSCAYSNIKNMKVSRILAESIGANVSVQKIKEQLYEQAKQLHADNSGGAGYSEDEKVSLEEIYRNLLRGVPMEYRQDMMLSYSLYQDFATTKIETTQDEKNIKEDADNLKVELDYIVISEADLLSKVGDTIVISDEELKKDYDEAIKNDSAPKNSKGEIPSFEERKPIIYNRLKSEKKQKLVSELKAKLQAEKGTESGTETLKKIADLAGVKISKTNKVALADLNKPGADSKMFRFTGNTTFLKDFIEIPFGKGKVGGPYSEGDKIAYVEFKELSFEKKQNTEKPKAETEFSTDRMRVYSISEEINQSVAGRYPIFRKLEK